MAGTETKLKIYQAACELFYNQGYNETTVAQIIDLAQTNKGSFYHHFDDKPHLGYNIITEMSGSIDMALRQIYPAITAIERLFLQEFIIWRLFFSQTGIRRFMAELYQASYIDLKAEYFDALLDLSGVDFSNRDLLMLQGVELSLRCFFTSYVASIAERLKEDELISFYMHNWLSLYQISSGVIDDCLAKARQVMSELRVANDIFRVEITLK